MRDERERQLADLETERQRHSRDERWETGELLRKTIAALARLYTTPPDTERTA